MHLFEKLCFSDHLSQLQHETEFRG